jgi:hypothetical protein
MIFSFHPRAEQELDKAVRYYEECCAGLGLEFAEEVYAAIARIIAYPKAWTRMSKQTRRCLVNRFPFGIVFQVKNSELRIIAVANLNRKPGYWKRRVIPVSNQ